MRGNLVYWVKEHGRRMRSINLSVCSEIDNDILNHAGIAELRRKRILRIIDEAREQGARLSYRDLSLILLTSKSTLKRDMKQIRGYR